MANIINVCKSFANFIRRHVAVVAIVGSLGIIGGLGLGFHIDTAVSNRSVQQADQYTEIYFDNYSHTKLVSGTDNAIPFTIANHTGSSRVYTYRVTLSEGGQTTVVYNGTLFLRDNQYHQQTAIVKPTESKVSKMLAIEIIGTGERIQLRSYQ